MRLTLGVFLLVLFLTVPGLAEDRTYLTRAFNETKYIDTRSTQKGNIVGLSLSQTFSTDADFQLAHAAAYIGAKTPTIVSAEVYDRKSGKLLARSNPLLITNASWYIFAFSNQNIYLDQSQEAYVFDLEGNQSFAWFDCGAVSDTYLGGQDYINNNPQGCDASLEIYGLPLKIERSSASNLPDTILTAIFIFGAIFIFRRFREWREKRK